MVIEAPDDNQVLQSAGDEELPVSQESEVACTQERSAIVSGQVCAESLARLLWTVPISFRHPGTGNPYLPHLVRPGWLARFRIHDYDVRVTPRLTAAHHCSGSGGVLPGCFHPVLDQRGRLRAKHSRFD